MLILWIWPLSQKSPMKSSWVWMFCAPMINLCIWGAISCDWVKKNFQYDTQVDNATLPYVWRTEAVWYWLGLGSHVGVPEIVNSVVGLDSKFAHLPECAGWGHWI
jgi:hypothetical protein